MEIPFLVIIIGILIVVLLLLLIWVGVLAVRSIIRPFQPSVQPQSSVATQTIAPAPARPAPAQGAQSATLPVAAQPRPSAAAQSRVASVTILPRSTSASNINKIREQLVLKQAAEMEKKARIGREQDKWGKAQLNAKIVEWHRSHP